MKLLLIEPEKSPVTIGGDDVFLYEPLALEYIAAGVVEEHDVKILDLRLEKNLPDVLASFSPDVVGITAYTVHVNGVLALFEGIKRWNPATLTVVGGHHATVAPGDFRSPHIDLIVIGEGVLTFKEIVRRFERGEGFDGITGIAFGKGDRLVRVDGEPSLDLDLFPFPARELTASHRDQYFSEWMRPLASIRTSKGCPFRCKFCALWKLTGGRYLKREPARVVEELGSLEQPFVFFADDESLVDAGRMMTLANLIKEAGIRKQYFLYGRSDTIVKNPGLLERWREIGLERIFVGLEFFRDEDLQYVGKNSTVSENEQAVKILNDLDIEIYGSFIVRPEFDHEDFKAYRRYCRTLKLGFPSFAMLTPLPGTDFYQEVQDRLITDNYDHFDFIHTVLPTKLPLKEFYQEFHQLLRTATSLRQQLAFLAKYSLREIPRTFAMSIRFYSRLKGAYRDYE